MRLFEGPSIERDAMADMMEVRNASYSELDVLCAMLSRNGVEHEHDERGPFRGVRFSCPHGRVTVVIGPGTVGFQRGLLEAYCEGWDLSPRGDLSARELYLTYMHGGF